MANMKILTIKGSQVSYNDKVAAPKLITNEEVFADALNAILVSRYIDDTSIKRYNSRKALTSAEKTMAEYEKDTLEYEKASKKADTAKANVAKYNAILDALRTEKENIGKVETPDDLTQIVNLYSALYSIVGGINTEGNKPMLLTLKGISELFRTCKTYADKYENTTDEWTDERKKDFAEIRAQLETIGARLNGDTTDNRKGFRYSASTKDTGRLVAFLTKHNDFSKSTGKFGEKRNDVYKFQHTVICTIFRIKEEDFQAANTIEF